MTGCVVAGVTANLNAKAGQLGGSCDVLHCLHLFIHCTVLPLIQHNEDSQLNRLR